MRDAVFDELVTVYGVAERLVEASEMTLGVEHGVGRAQVLERCFHELGRESTAPLVGSSENPPEAWGVGVAQDSEGCGDTDSIGEPDVFGARIEISAVDVEIHAGLLHHEDLGTDRQQVIELTGREIGTGDNEHRLNLERSNPRRWAVRQMFMPFGCNDGSMENFAVNGDIQLAWDRQGAGQPLLLINGLGSPRIAFEQGFVDLLVGAGFEVVRFDNRDVGHSSRATAPYALADQAADAVAVLDAAGWPRAHVFGQSMGGMIAQTVAVVAPARVITLTSLMSTTGNRTVGRPTAEALESLLVSPPADPEGWLANRLVTEKIWCSPAHWDPTWVEAKGRAMIAHGVDPAGSVRQFRAVVAGGERDADLAALEMPTLVLHGSADTLVDPSGGRHTAELISDSRHVEIDGMGHDLAPAFWSRIVAELSGFVAENS